LTLIVVVFDNIDPLDFKAPYTATAIELLEKAGVIMGGKINMDEFGMGCVSVQILQGKGS
jgi:Asp-tRNA(Asn)/Glu-tRNA(Gln) amidotransferase A subunit family amidase